MDVQTRELGAGGIRRETWWTLGVAAIVLLALALRLHGINNPILDHPGWRQGDTAAIARNFARLQFNFMYPQTLYNGPPPNYVELELQIVPFLTATLYKVFGVHEIFGRLVTLAFSLATVVTLAHFARWLFTSSLAGITAAFFFAVFPGSVYYGRSFMPDTAMVFFLTAALYGLARFLLEDPTLAPRMLARTAALLTFAYLAKPVAVIAVLPLAAVVAQRLRAGLATRASAAAVLLIVPLAILWLYDRRVASYAEWHWASGITTLHVLPALRDAFGSFSGFAAKCAAFRSALGMLSQTMLGSTGFACSVAAFFTLPWVTARSKPLLWAWLIAALAYVFVVVTVERVDYYMYPLLPLCALAIGGAAARFVNAAIAAVAAPAARYALVALLPVLGLVVLVQGRAAVAPYYDYNPQAYRNALRLDAALDKHALVVIGHYGPDVQYYLDRFGWEEDAALWTPFDEESAIRKGARYFISIEDDRLRRNVELCAWLQRFPVFDFGAPWIVYETDPAKTLPNADALWKAFRAAERAGKASTFLDRLPRCATHPPHGPIASKVRSAAWNASGPTVIVPR
ncbi:MAG: glycosyltransferase family 39 protein [Candidatus Tumulicola sp.]